MSNKTKTLAVSYHGNLMKENGFSSTAFDSDPENDQSSSTEIRKF